jgi:hypothetical protein
MVIDLSSYTTKSVTIPCIWQQPENTADAEATSARRACIKPQLENKTDAEATAYYCSSVHA